MKMKNKTKTLIPLIIIVGLFLAGMNTSAGIVLDTTSIITYPETVKLGDILAITITFDYEAEADCLYGPRIFLNYKLSSSVKYATIQEPSLDDPEYGEALGRPDSITISIDTTTLLDGVEDEIVTLTFQLQYDTGFLYYVGDVKQISKVDTAFTDWHELTIDNTPRTIPLLYIYIGSAVVGLIVIGLVVYLIKRRK
jgi:hypothetical protein